MKLELHPNAIVNYNEKAERLLTQLTTDPYADQSKRRSSLDPGIYLHELPKDSIIDVKFDSYVDGQAKEIAKYFKDESKTIGLFEDGYRSLVQLAEDMQTNNALRDLVSKVRLKDLIFNWITSRHKESTISAMTEYVLTECEREIKEIEIWIPISMLLIFQSEITIGKVTFKTVTKEMLNAWLTPKEKSSREMSPEARLGLTKIRSKLQGYAAATIKLRAEPKRAYEIAYDEADKAVSLLRFYSPVNFDPSRVSYVSLLGREHIETTHCLLVQNGKIVNYPRALVDQSSPYWQLDPSYIADLRNSGLDILGDLLALQDRTDFQDKLLASLLQYTKNSLAMDPSDKLINILVALESAILRDENEPLGKNIGERMAALIGTTVAERKEIISNVTKIYGLRSSFIHHGKRISLDELETLKEFMTNAWRCLGSLIDLHHKNSNMTRSQFFAWLEERRLSY